jgi:glycosyltransferase involved in cell wall biosynthesis
LRICHVNDMGWPAGGAEKSIQILRAALSERGHQVRVIATDKDAFGRDDVFADDLIPHITGDYVRRFCRYLFYRTAYRQMRQVIASFRPHIVHFHTVGELSPAALHAAARTPFVMTVHGPEDFTRGRNGTYRRADLRAIGHLRILYLKAIQRRAYLAALRRCRAMVAPSSFIAGVLEQDVASDRIVQIYNGIDLPAFARPPKKGRFLFVGRLEAVKGVDVLLRAFARARRHCPDITLTILGDGSQHDALRRLALRLDVSTATQFRGRVGPQQVLDALVDCDVLAIPSVWPENLPTVALEAMGVGRAILGSRVGGIPELVCDGVNGLLADPYDEHRLAEHIVRLASWPELSRRMGEAGRQRAGAYCVDTFVDRTIDLYARAIGALPGQHAGDDGGYGSQQDADRSVG